MNLDPELSVVVCSFNGSEGLKSTLDCLNRQTIRNQIEIIVVDDGSNPPIREIDVTSRNAILIRHGENFGVSAARNSGLSAARAPIVAFTDDDCRPTEKWAEALVSAYADPMVAGAGGPVFASGNGTFLARYYSYNEPIHPLEADLGRSTSLFKRFWLYVCKNFREITHAGIRDAYSLPCANCSFRRSVLNDIGGFDVGIRFGGEDEDLCHRLRKSYPSKKLRIIPDAIVKHDYEFTMKDMTRRAKAYGVGGARNYLKHRELSPTLYPAPAFWTLALMTNPRNRRNWVIFVILPLVMAPRWVIGAFRSKSPEQLTYPYIQMVQEFAHNVGFFEGLIRFRSLKFTENPERRIS